MEKKKDTAVRIARRNYEKKHSKERKAQNKVWGTSIPRSEAEEIDAFLAMHNLSKVSLIMAGYAKLQEQYRKKDGTSDK